MPHLVWRSEKESGRRKSSVLLLTYTRRRARIPARAVASPSCDLSAAVDSYWSFIGRSQSARSQELPSQRQEMLRDPVDCRHVPFGAHNLDEVARPVVPLLRTRFYGSGDGFVLAQLRPSL